MLNSLAIKNFRCLKDFQVARLGRLNLIVGGNNSGKSTVLEAIQIYAGNGNGNLLVELAKAHDEHHLPVPMADFSEDMEVPFKDFFSGRQWLADVSIPVQIGPIATPEQTLYLRYELTKESEKDVRSEDGRLVRLTHRESISPEEAQASPTRVSLTMEISRGSTLMRLHLGRDRVAYPWINVAYGEKPVPDTVCRSVPTQFVSIDELGRGWDAIALQDEQTWVVEALQVLEPDLVALTFVGGGGEGNSRSAVVKLKGHPQRIPLKSLGDGVRRVLQIALQLVTARNGFLLIDEFENGLHYSVQPKVWTMLFELAEKLNVQVFATTHSWDCIKAFADVAKANQQVDGVLFRMGRSARTSNKGQVIATVYDEQALHDMTQADLELR